MEIGIQEVNTKRVDHYGIIVGVCDELEIVEQIDSILGPIDPRKNISYGQAVKLMIINGLGFVNHRLYMTKNFYRDKPLELLMGEGVELENVNDYVLGKTLEKIGQFGVTPIFSAIAMLKTLNKKGRFIIATSIIVKIFCQTFHYSKNTKTNKTLSEVFSS